MISKFWPGITLLTGPHTVAIKVAEGFWETVIIDILSHAWAGQGGTLKIIDRAKSKYQGIYYVAWRDVTLMHNALVEAMLQNGAHIIACMRAKTDYVQEKDDNGKTVVRKVGMAPIQREGMEYEFDIVLDIDWDHRAGFSKTRCEELADKVFLKPGEEVGKLILDWLTSGAPAPAPQPKIEPAKLKTQKDLIALAKQAHNLDDEGVSAGLGGSRDHRVRAETVG